MTPRPNILMILVDEMRGDAMGVAGHPDVKTPHLDTLASQGVYFDKAYSACPSCIAARATLMTGMIPAHTGRVGYEDGVPWRYEHTLAGELSCAGYYAQCVGKMHVHPLRNLLGYHHIELHDGHLHFYRKEDQPLNENQCYLDDYFYWLRRELGVQYDVNDTGMDCNSWLTRPWPYEERLHPTNWVTDRSIDFLRRRDREKPFFLTVSYVRPHAPYDPPQAFYDMYINKPLRPPVRGDWDDQARLEAEGRIYDGHVGPVDPEQIRRQQAGYYGCITHVDYEIGRLLNALREAGVDKDTVILFTSDHGELLSDHGMDRKSLPYEGSAHIPMILYGPEKWIGPARRDHSLVELMDVMPTLLALAGADVPATVDGKSMLQGVTREYLHGEHLWRNQSVQFIITKTDKYVWFSEEMREQYFRIDLDPTETHNRIAEPEDQRRIAELRSLLIRCLTGREEGFTDGEKLLPGSKPRAVLRAAQQQ